MRKCRRQPRAAAGIASARPVAKCRCERCCSRHCECPSRRQVQMCRIQARAQISSADVSHELQQALRVAVPSPSADASAAAAGIASARPVAKCRFAEFRRARALLQQAASRALLQQAALRVPVPSPSADLQNSGASAAAAAGRCRPSLRSLSAARRSLGRPKTASFGLFLGRFSVLRWGAVSGRLDVAFVQQGRCCPSLRSPSVARRSLGRPKTASFGLFLGRFRVPRRPQRAVRNVSHLSTLEPPGWHRGGWGFRIAGKVPPVASFALRRSPLARAAQNGQFWPVFGPFSRAAVGRGERSSGRGIGVAGKVLPFASFSVRRSPLARAAKNGQFWPVFGPFSRAAATAASGAKRQPSQHPGTPRVAQGWMGLSYSREGAARRFVRSPPLAVRSCGPKRPVLACFWAVFVCCGGRGERSSGRGIGVAGKVLPFASFAVRRSPLARAAKNGQFWPVFGPFSRAAATGRCRPSLRSLSAARRSLGRPKTASFGLFLGRFRVPRWARERSSGRGIGVAGKVLPFASFAVRRSPLARVAKNGQFWPVFGPFSRAAAIAARSGCPKRAVLACFWAVFACCGGRGERSSGRGIRVAGKVLLPFASFADRRSPLARAAKNGQFWPVFGPFSRPAATLASGAKRQPSQHPGTPRVAQGWMGLSYSREGAARCFVRSPPLAARSGGPKRAVLACFWAVFACCGGRCERSSGRGIRVAGKVLPFASFAVRRSPLARVAKNGQFWPVFGPFSRAAATAASGAKRQPSQHPGTPRVAQGWMGLSYSREGAARRFVRSPPLAARSGGPKRAVLACFWAVFVCCGGRGERSSGRGIRVAGKVLPFPLFPLRSLGAAQNGQFWPVSWLFLRSALTAFAASPLNGTLFERSYVRCLYNLPGPLWKLTLFNMLFHFSFAMRMRSVIVRAPCVSSNDGLSQTPRLDWLQRSRECSWTQWIRLSLGSLDSWRMIGWLS
ncbi:hypothetical protein OPV22_034736 [Ensete ventricosum]|uniref:Uncharacterized protein n=1 Tax=Ensete ventricosum TaxID=4639 RepID=A0AAV8P0Q1_ENSVE|nr:hypothetical protein OPV22_034736 [Ensete ventricosum]